MTDYTPNYNFQLPDFDQRFWHDEMRRILKGFDSVLAKYVAVGNVKGVWSSNTAYNLGDVIVDEDVGNLYECAVNHVSANTGSFADDRIMRPSYWINASITNRYRGAWASGIEYRAGDFVVSGNKYAVATQLFTSGTTFASDAAAGRFETLIDLTAIPASAVPVPNVSTALNYVRQNSAGDGYEVVPIGTVVAQMALGSLAFLNQVTTANINSGAATNGQVIAANGSGGTTWQTFATMPAGSVIDYAGTIAPSGWLLCAGQAISRTTYSDLFTAIGTTYGVGDGTTTFNVPDLRGRVVAGKDDMNGTAANRLTTGGSGINGASLGAVGGTQTHTLSTSEMPAHVHSGGFGSGSGDFIGGGGSGPTNTGSTGGGGAHQNTQPTLILNKIIKA